MEQVLNQPPATLESVWEGFRETERLRKESDAKFYREREEARAEIDRLRKESDARFYKEREEARAAFEREMKESREAFDQRMKKLDERIGSMANNNGLIAEEYFFNAFEAGQTNFFGEKFDKIRKNKGGIEIDDEYDILLINGHTVGIVETKYKAHENDLPKILKKAETFRINFPQYANHKVYLGLASLAFYPILEQECINQGIAIVKQVGNTVTIYDEHLKAY